MRIESNDSRPQLCHTQHYIRGVARRTTRTPVHPAHSRQRDSCSFKSCSVAKWSSRCLGYFTGPRQIMVATYAAPKPLSILTTVTLGEQEFSIPNSAAKP
jgi:hypothetical protein